MDQQSKSFIHSIFFMMGFFALGIVITLGIHFFASIKMYDILFFIFIFLLVLGIISLLIIIVLYLRIYNSQKVFGNPTWFLKGLRFLYPFMNFICRFFQIPLIPLQHFCIQINNKCIETTKIKISKKDILVLTPHCIQNSSCSIKITHNPNLCKHCGKCPVDDLLDIKNRYSISLAIVTGGTLARVAVKQYQPKMIIAVACERDLISGMMDISQIPVIGILNQRPYGPCRDTYVDVNKIEYYIQKYSY